ncbi:MAG TPA: hypothetical protein VF702_00670 [Allosphingosinicella sp.]
MIFLKRNGFRVKVFTERASVCPVGNKFDPNFNVWTACHALAELAEVVSNESRRHDVVVLDRGLFDSVCWFRWQLARRHLDQEHFDLFREFFFANRWSSRIDIVYILTASPETALEREYATLLTRKYGSVMNPRVLSTYNNAIAECAELYRSRFRDVRSVDTSNLRQNDVSYTVTTDILQALDELVSERVGYFHRNDLSLGDETVLDIADSGMLRAKMHFGHRAEVEASSDYVQPIPVAVLTSESRDRTLIVRKSKGATSPTSAEKGKDLFYFGGHVRAEDATPYFSNMDIFGHTLQRELKEELGFDYIPDFVESICIVDRSKEPKPRHIAIATVCVVDFESAEFSGDEKEFRDRSLVVLPERELRFSKLSPERWSQAIIERLLKWVFL